MNKEFNDINAIKNIVEYKFPRWDELPSIELYIDQVINYVLDIFKIYKGEDESNFLTKSMINNYVKQKVLIPPVNKKYTRTHVAHIIFICVLKQIFSMNEIQKFIIIQSKSYDTKTAYNYFCTELENAIKITFNDRQNLMPNITKNPTKETDIVRSIVLAVSNKVYVEKMSEYMFKVNNLDEVQIEEKNKKDKKQKTKNKK